MKTMGKIIILTFGSERRHCWHRRQCQSSYLITFDDDEVCSHCGTTCLHEEHAVDLIIIHPMLFYNCVNADVVAKCRRR